MVTLLRRHTTISVIMLLTACCVISPSPLHLSSSHSKRVPFPLHRRLPANTTKAGDPQNYISRLTIVFSSSYSFRARRVIFGVPVADLRSTVVFHVTECHFQNLGHSPVSHFRHRRSKD